MSKVELSITHALKEWEVAVSTLAAGKMILLLRKGGIREVGGKFEVKYRRVLLYPTYEHQKTHLLKPEYGNQVTPVPSGWHPESIPISSWADITDIFSVSSEVVVRQLFPYHIWQEEFVSDRLKWKPRQPLYLLLLRVYKLPETSIVPYDISYSGCQSWIDLLKPISLAGSVPVLADVEYQKRVNSICEIMKNF